MAASTADLNTTTFGVDSFSLPVAASTIIYQNQLCCYDANGNIVPASDTANLVFAGSCSLHIDNSAGIAGAVNAPIRPPNIGPENKYIALDCSGATQAWCGVAVFFTDDHTVAQSSVHSVKAGVVRQFLSATKVIVELPNLA